MTDRILIRTTGQTGPGISFVSVLSYGAVGNGTTDDTAAVQAALDAIPATGGAVYFPTGTYLVTGVTVSNPTCLFGDGGDMTSFTTPAAPSQITCASATATAVTIAAHGCSIEHLAIINTSGTTPTDGSAVLVTDGDGFRMFACSLVKFYDQLDIEQGRYGRVTDCHFFDSARWGARLRNTAASQGDFGDHSFHGNTFCSLFTSRICTAAVQWESGGGLRFVNNKTNGNYNTLGQSQNVGLNVAVADGISTSVLNVIGNSFEGIESAGAPIVITQTGTGTGTFSKVVIVGNETLSGAGIRVNGLQTGKLSNIVIADNVLTSPSVGIYLNNCSNVTVGRNRIMSLATDAVAVEVNAGVTDYVIDEQMCDTERYQPLLDNSVSTTSHSRSGSAASQHTRAIPSVTSSVTYVNLFTVQFNAYAGAVIDIELAGQIAGVGGFSYKASRCLVQGATATTPTLTTVGTDVATANAPTVTFDIASNQTLIVKVRLPGSGTDVFGLATMRITGNASRVFKS